MRYFNILTKFAAVQFIWNFLLNDSYKQIWKGQNLVL